MQGRKWICLISVISIVMLGCHAKEYKINEQEISSIIVPASSYALAGEKIRTIEKSEYEEGSIVYYVEDELELAKVLEYNIMKDNFKVSFQSTKTLDMDKTANYVSYIEPYDISLELSTTDFEDSEGKVLYRSNHVEIKNLDERYTETKNAAKQIYNRIIKPEMDADQKIEAIHNYLAKSTIYSEIHEEDRTKYPNVFKAGGALIDKTAVCSGYSRAFLMLARLSDVPAIYVSSDRLNHGWNLVYGNTGWRYVDVTWDDPIPDIPGFADNKYLNVSIEEFMRDGRHIFDSNRPSDYFLDVAKSYFSKKVEEFQ